jgi:hypothetical protein
MVKRNVQKKPNFAAIVRAAIHPAIGIARVGDSKREYFFGPEVIDPQPKKPGSYKDLKGALKREAARFRIYGFDAKGNVVAELTAGNADIDWSVHVANNKAAWYQFQIALDIPEAIVRPADVPPSGLRNSMEFDRTKLSIDGGSLRIRGRNRAGPKYRFDKGRFYKKKVYLGELRTDEKGRLIFLAGHGDSASNDGKPVTAFANNDGWHDDVADGPVTATVSIAGKLVPCEGAWVVSAPPNFAPDLVGVRNMFDLLESLYVEGGWIPEPAAVSFSNDILPILTRLSRLQWVNSGFYSGFGWKAPYDFEDDAYLRKLARKPTKPDSLTSDPFKELRRQIANAFRVYSRDSMSPVPWPWIYGDAMDITPVSPRQYSTLTPLQMRRLARWVDGDFLDDYGKVPAPVPFAKVPLPDQPAMLDRAALTFCLADVFHPGCEITWVIRHLSMFSAPFRIKHRAPDVPEPNYGSVLTPEAALGIDGPLYDQAPGGLTRWMALPWQADSASCQCGYDLAYDPRLPTFWAARVPNQVLTEDDYAVAINRKRSPQDRLEAFNTRPWWMRFLSKNWQPSMNQMVRNFGSMGVVETRKNPLKDGLLPPVMLVESVPGPIAPFPPPPARVRPEPVRRQLPVDKVHRFLR